MNATFELLEIGGSRKVYIDPLKHDIREYYARLDSFLKSSWECVFPDEDWLLVREGNRVELRKGPLCYCSLYFGFGDKKARNAVWQDLESYYLDYCDSLCHGGFYTDKNYNFQPPGEWVGLIEYNVPGKLKKENQHWIDRLILGVAVICYLESTKANGLVLERASHE